MLKGEAKTEYQREYMRRRRAERRAGKSKAKPQAKEPQARPQASAAARAPNDFFDGDIVAKLKHDIEALRIGLRTAQQENERKQAIIRKFQEGRASSGDTFLRDKVEKLERTVREERQRRRFAEKIPGVAMDDDLYRLMQKALHSDAGGAEARLKALQAFNGWATDHVPGQMKKERPKPSKRV